MYGDGFVFMVGKKKPHQDHQICSRARDGDDGAASTRAFGQLVCRSVCFGHLSLRLPLLSASDSISFRVSKESQVKSFLPICSNIITVLSWGDDSSPFIDPHSH